MTKIRKFNENVNYDKIANIFRAEGEGEDELDYLTPGEQEGELWDMLRNDTISIEDLKSFRDNPTGNITIGADDNGIIDDVIKSWEDENIDNESGTDIFDKKIIFVTLWDDWRGIYIDGDLLEDGHSLDCSSVLEELVKREVNLGGYSINSLRHEKDGRYVDWAEDQGEPIFGRLPQSLKEYVSKVKELGFDYKL